MTILFWTSPSYIQVWFKLHAAPNILNHISKPQGFRNFRVYFSPPGTSNPTTHQSLKHYSTQNQLRNWLGALGEDWNKDPQIINGGFKFTQNRQDVWTYLHCNTKYFLHMKTGSESSYLHTCALINLTRQCSLSAYRKAGKSLFQCLPF